MLYGNIQKILEDSSTFSQTHRLESVKILPPIGETDPELWGDITQQGVHLAEIESPETVRIICMAVTSDDIRDEGYPSSWSAAIDQISSGALDMKQRLFVVSCRESVL